ncbi:MAG: cadherin-like domain-containing protein [Planctomycetales bacterium]
MVIEWFPRVLRAFRRSQLRFGRRPRQLRHALWTTHLASGTQPLEERVLLAVDLQPYALSGWSNKVVVSTQPGTNTDASAYTIGDYNYYLDAGMANFGTTNASAFHSTLTLDGTYQVTINSSSGLQSFFAASMQDYQFNTGFLSAGSHSYVFNVDSANEVSESDETNNSYTRSITVGLPSSSTSLSIPTVDILSATSGDWLETAGTIAANVSKIYSFSLANPSGLFLDLDSRDISSPLSGTLNAAMALYDVSGNLLATNDNGFDFRGFNTPSTVVSTASAAGFLDPAIYADLAAGNYYIAVAGVSGTTGEFKLRALADSNYSATVPVFNSNPGATDTLYLDFDGYSATDAWGTYSATPYSLDGNSSTFSPGERLAMKNLCRTTSEDYSPFNLNVTPVAPGSIVDGQSLRMVATNSSPSIVGQPSGTLGVALRPSYSNGTANDNVAFLFHSEFETYNGFGASLDGKIMAGGLEEGDTVSHEFGHSLGLRHYNSQTGNFAGNADIIPNAILATPKTGLSRAIWATGNADAGSNTTVSQDDVAVISSVGNTIGYRTDDYGDTAGSATTLVLSGASYSVNGIIQTIGDKDYFKFYASGSTTISVDVDEYINDLNTQLFLYSSDGVTQIGSSNPSSSYDATITQTLAAGDYYVQIASHGSYGEIGQYSLRIDLTENPPSITSNGGGATASISIDENTTAVTTVTATDPDSGASLTYSIVGGADAAKFAINSTTGVLNFVSAPNFDAPGDFDLNNIYDVVVQVSDGVLTDSQAIAVTVANINEAPAGTDNIVTTLEDSEYAFAASDFGFTDTSDSPANTLLAVKITTLPTAGSLTLSGNLVSAGQFLPVSSIGNLKFTPAANANGTGYASFTFQVQDDGGTSGGGVDLDQSPNTITVDVTSINDAPAGDDNTVTALEDTDYTLTAVDFGFSDADDSPADNLLAVIVNPSTAGTLKYDGNTVTGATTIPVADIDSGKLVFAPATNASGTGDASFTFQVQDDGGTANSGNDTSSEKTLTVDVTSVNDAPAGTDATVTTPEDTDYAFTAADFGFTDPNDSPANSLLAVKITTLPATGSLSLSGNPVTAGQFIPVAGIGNLKFTPASNANGYGYTSFTFQVQDDGGTASSGVDLDQSPNSITINVTPVNDGAPVLNPTGNPSLLSIPEDTFNSSGTSIKNLIAGTALGNSYITDVDATDPKGLALYSAPSSGGNWQYSLNNGGIWTTISGISPRPTPSSSPPMTPATPASASSPSPISTAPVRSTSAPGISPPAPMGASPTSPPTAAPRLSVLRRTVPPSPSPR